MEQGTELAKDSRSRRSPARVPQRPIKLQDKYFLRALHEEIALYDRKLSHLEKYEQFSSAKDRELALGKMTTKRDTLARTARRLVEEGIEFCADDLPPSFRPLA